MSEYYGGDDSGYYDENGDYHQYNGDGGGGGATGPNGGGGGGAGEDPSYPYGGGLPVWSATGTGSGDDPTGGGSQPPSGGPSGGFDYFNNPFPPSGPIETGGSPRGGGGITFTPPGTPNSGGSSSVSNTQNNTQNNSNVLAQSVGLGAVSPISSGVPQAAASSFKPNVISQGGLHEGQPPPMPTPHAQVPPTLHPEKPTDWANVNFGAAAAPQQGNPASKTPQSTLGKIGSALGAVTGMGQAAKRYKGLYDAIHPPKAKTPEELQAEAYRQTYGL